MKHLLIIFSLLLISVSWSKDVKISDLVKVGGLFYEKFSDVPFTGNTIGHTQGQIKNGIKVGKWTKFRGNGKIVRIENFNKKGWKHGNFIKYSNSKKWISKTNEDIKWKNDVSPIFQSFTDNTPGTFIILKFFISFFLSNLFAPNKSSLVMSSL